jgi:hypothetical protein
VWVGKCIHADAHFGSAVEYRLRPCVNDAADAVVVRLLACNSGRLPIAANQAQSDVLEQVIVDLQTELSGGSARRWVVAEYWPLHTGIRLLTYSMLSDAECIICSLSRNAMSLWRVYVYVLYTLVLASKMIRKKR